MDRLVLVCTSYGGRGPQPISPQVLGRMFGLGSLSPESAVRRGLETAASAAYRSGYSEEFEQIVRWRLADSPSLPYFYQQAMAGARFDASGEVRNITSPTLVIHGADDCYVPVANARALAKAIPGAKLHVLERAAHLVFIEQAEEVNKHVLSFLQPRKPRRRQKPKELLTPTRPSCCLNPEGGGVKRRCWRSRRRSSWSSGSKRLRKKSPLPLGYPNPKGAPELKEDLQIRKQQSYRSSLRKVGHRQEIEQGKGELC